MIVTASTYFGGKSLDWWLLGVMVPLARRSGVRLREPSEDLPPVPTHVNEGRWKVKCPDGTCHGYEEAWEENFFVCGSCLNSAVGHRVLRTAFPADRVEIESILTRRPLMARNWELYESTAELMLQNAAHSSELIPAGQE